jgi:hypothetical protein
MVATSMGLSTVFVGKQGLHTFFVSNNKLRTNMEAYEHNIERYEWTESRIWLDLYRLLAFFHASPKLRHLKDDLDIEYQSIENLRATCEKAEIHEVLLKLAAGFRVQQDQQPDIDGQSEPSNVNRWHNNCGLFWPNMDDGASEQLNLREACNKIIHATGFEHVYAEYADSLHYSLAPRIRLHGHRNHTKWKAELDILKFVDCLFYNYEGA